MNWKLFGGGVPAAEFESGPEYFLSAVQTKPRPRVKGQEMPPLFWDLADSASASTSCQEVGEVSQHSIGDTGRGTGHEEPQRESGIQAVRQVPV